LLTTQTVKQTEGNDVTEQNEVNEFCLLETMRARCRWNSEVIVMTSARWGRMKTGGCLKIDARRLASNSDDPMFLGCYEDVLSLLDMKCSSKPSCDVVVPNPDLDKVTPCYEDITRYLEASYTCVKGTFCVHFTCNSTCNLSFGFTIINTAQIAKSNHFFQMKFAILSSDKCYLIFSDFPSTFLKNLGQLKTNDTVATLTMLKYNCIPINN